jgi:hypothetical protein
MMKIEKVQLEPRNSFAGVVSARSKAQNEA